MKISKQASFLCFDPQVLVISVAHIFNISVLPLVTGSLLWQLMLKVSSVCFSCVPKCVCISVERLCICLCACVTMCKRMRERDKKEMKSRSEELSHSEASPSVRLGLIVPGCEDTHTHTLKKKGGKATVLVPLSQSYFCNIKRAPPACSRLLPCK